jgi:AraC family transcriptional regulator
MRAIRMFRLAGTTSMQAHAIPDNAIATLHHGAFGRIDYVRCNGLVTAPAHRDVAIRLHFSLPLAGSFVWHTEREDVFADPTALLCTQAGEPYRISHPHGGDETLVLTPSMEALAHLSERAERTGLAQRRRMTVAPARTQLLAYTLCADPLTRRDAFAADELLLQMFESIATGMATDRNTRDDALVRRALDYVHGTTETRLTLKGVASALGVRAAYLTHAFARRVGQPLYRYVISLKLARALHCIATTDDDLTDIALDLGFSSHSHLSAAFRARYGIAPSRLRHRHERPPQTGAERGQANRDAVHSGLHWRPLCPARGGLGRVGAGAGAVRAMTKSPYTAPTEKCREMLFEHET